MEKPVEKLVRGDRRVQQFAGRGAAHQDDGAAPVLVRRRLVPVRPVRRRQALDHQGRRPRPACLREAGASLRRRQVGAVAAAPVAGAPAGAVRPPGYGVGEHDGGLQLAGLAKVMMRAVGQAGAFQGAYALVAFAVRPLVDGERQVAGPEQARHRAAGAAPGRIDALRVEAGVAAHVPLVGDVGDDHAQGAVALGLQGEDAVEAQGVGEHRRQGQGLGHHAGHPHRIAVGAEDRLQGRTQAHQLAAQAEGLDAEGLDQVAERCGFGHARCRMRGLALAKPHSVIWETENMVSAAGVASRRCRPRPGGRAGGGPASGISGFVRPGRGCPGKTPARRRRTSHRSGPASDRRRP